MDYRILTGGNFFRCVSQNTDDADIRSAYDDFSQAIFDSYVHADNPHGLLFSLIYAEAELQSLHDTFSDNADSKSVYLKKALSLVRRMLENLKSQVPPLSTPQTDSPPTSSFRWTGSLVELIEVIYALDELGCINDVQNKIKELAAFFGSQLGLEIKDRHCYDAYLDMKRRKNESRTYFLDKMRERLNLRMQRDDAKENARR
ncbi:RteC domain-containing protein [Odoribacter laneus]|uniref:RteC protein n=1 Tax=Odoribacter laneus YIT 12061 TaxID=742817 RepID=H1DHB0_9BACT|nr:RteC domain-containing protein [Odoribacter laneus]EHP47793.1 hypothetical protein HMPREF9449_01646 [Odoribacter laneus YIT 12061]MBS1445239.1 transcriptional regulator [Odoribacter sp.]